MKLRGKLMVSDAENLPFKDNTFDEVAAYDFLEHIGIQGDWRGYFKEFGEYHRVLKKGGELCVLVPNGAGNAPDKYCDPGHIRFFTLNHFGFLHQGFYEENQKKQTAGTDYRHVWDKNFDPIWQEVTDKHIAVVLKKT